ncbi:hypothetical protein FBZ94_102170 [Bradyrhizobium sacchari]|uniref:Uncharacterized protein n=1 Tax=Bradyrhizobium sacchari TaxID=1399419 RepID=A0A560KG72_9BRAD|nr:hypothetical protein FBZ94_102170 [Bradyrhizobium sacchari]TWB80954.1 hypothetical protein FBZ95_102171 [Bradyrhizobium sacchari]
MAGLSSAEAGLHSRCGVLGVARVGGTVVAAIPCGFGSRPPPLGPYRRCKTPVHNWAA